MNDKKNEREIAIKNIKYDFKLLSIAIRRLGIDIAALIKSVELPSSKFLPNIKKVKLWWAVVPLLLLLVVFVFLFIKSFDKEYTSVSIKVERPYSFGYKPSVQPPVKAHRVSGINCGRAFNDKNDVQLAVAKKIGIKPLETRENIGDASRRLVETDDSDAYMVDKLTHSMPYLVPEAAALLSRIGRNFQDSLVMKHLAPHKIIVTSVLRTKHDVKRLRKGNVNSSENSAHCFGTTFDISWKRFLSEHGETTENSAKLKLVLAEVLRDLKREGSCYVKHEKKQACFHITARDFPKK